MADFAELCVAAGIPNFVEVYSANINLGCQEAVEAHPIASGILSLLEAHDGYWQGSSTELIRRLQELDPTNREIQKLSARSLGKKLSSSLRGELEAVGVEVDQGKGSRGQRYLMLNRVAKEQPAESQGQQPPSIQQSNEVASEMTNNQAPTPADPAPEQHKGSADGAKSPTTANGQLVRFLDRDPVPPQLRGREARFERETFRNVVVRIGGVRQSVPKDWLVKGSTDSGKSQNGSLLPRTEEGSTTGPSAAGDARTKAPTGRSDPQSATNGSLTDSNQEDRISIQEWNRLLDTCCRAGVSHLDLKKVISEAAGIPMCDVGTVALTRAQYRRAMDYLANYRGEEGG